MPEGPSLRRWQSMTSPFIGRKITRISGSSKTVDKVKWAGAFLAEVEVHGKQLFLHLQRTEKTPSTSQEEDVQESVWIRCHFLMWGSVRVNEFNCKPSKTNRFPEPRLVFYFSKEEFIVFYGGSFRELDQPPQADSTTDILSNAFDRFKAVEHILEDLPICFTLLDQRKFTGLGNIIKNEVLFTTATHPMQLGSSLSQDKAAEIVDDVIAFSKRWLAWKMEEKPSEKFGDWTKIYKKTHCPLGHQTTRSLFGPCDMQRITYWCPTCQPVREDQDGGGEAIDKELKVVLQSKHTNADDFPTISSEDYKDLSSTEKDELEPSSTGNQCDVDNSANQMQRGNFLVNKSSGNEEEEQWTLASSCVHAEYALGCTSLPPSQGEMSVPCKLENISPPSFMLSASEAPQETYIQPAKKRKTEHEAIPSAAELKTLVLPHTSSLSPINNTESADSLQTKSLCCQLVQQDDEDESARISLSLSTLQLLMRRNIRVKICPVKI